MRKKICIIASSPSGIISFWRTNIEKLSTQFDIYIVCNYEDECCFDSLKIISAHKIGIERRPSLIKDLMALKELYCYFRNNNFDAFISMSSKASLLSAIAGCAAHVPVRIRIFTGQIWANKTGMSRLLFKIIDKLTVKFNTDSLVDGKSQQEYLIQNKILKPNQSLVLADGSICGVDINKFSPNQEIRTEERTRLQMSDNDVVFAFMGRINRDKGVFELLSAFNELLDSNKNVILLLIGNTEGVDDETFASYSNIVLGDNLKCYGWTSNPQYALQAADVFCLPSYREGFGMSVIEAAALSLPVICSDAYGLRDSFINEVTGLKCKLKDVPSLVKCMKILCEDVTKRKRFGQRGRQRIIDEFSKERLSNAWLHYFKNKL